MPLPVLAVLSTVLSKMTGDSELCKDLHFGGILFELDYAEKTL